MLRLGAFPQAAETRNVQLLFVYQTALWECLLHLIYCERGMVLDNARIHHEKLIQPFLETYQDSFEFLFLPPYSPDLNLIEGLWKWMKATVIHNVFYSNVGKIQRAVQGFIQMINQTPKNTVNRLCLKL
ncbi:MAG: transposase [Caryophanon sp.]|nr:transposase [Caryophanon sp.]